MRKYPRVGNRVETNIGRMWWNGRVWYRPIGVGGRTAKAKPEWWYDPETCEGDLAAYIGNRRFKTIRELELFLGTLPDSMPVAGHGGVLEVCGNQHAGNVYAAFCECVE